MRYEAVIGMEVHVQLLTASKMFCGCSADYASAPPNTHTCPVCLGMPGVLPVINQRAMEATLLAGLALHCRIPAYAKFDRKNYPYPDLPKGYQISQYDLPFCVEGWVQVPSGEGTRRIGIRRVHLEEDTAKLVHEGDSSLIDFNRAGVPLMEIVTESDLRTADEAWHYLSQLRTTLRYLGVSTGNMEEGAMRCEVNISLRPVGSQRLGTKVEIKNLNSFRAVRQSIAYEIERQAEVLDKGEAVHQVTMGWDEDRHCTVFQRSKEQAEDYRYFPEPDLPPLVFTEGQVEALRQRLPELPDAKRERFIAQYTLKPDDAAVLVEDRAVADYFEAAVATAPVDAGAQMVANWMLGELFRLLRESGSELAQVAVSPQQLGELLGLVAGGTINATVGKDVLNEMFRTGQSAPAIVSQRGLTQISDAEQLRAAIRTVVAQQPKAVQDYQAGKDAAVRFLIGQVMRLTRGQAQPQKVEQLLREELSKSPD